VFASSAFATAVTTNSNWYVAGTKLASGETREIKCSKDGSLVLRSTAFGGIEITAGKLECPSGGVIKQEGEHGITTVTLKFSELTVMKPTGCTSASSITTKALVAKTLMEGTTTYVKFEPTEGETGTFANLTLTGCAAEGIYPVKGSACAKASNEIGVEAVDLTLTFSEGAQTAACSGSSPIEGGMNEELVSGSAFITRE